MAGSAWIMIDQEMPDKPEVDQLANELGVDFDSVIGKLVRFWLWAERQRINCNDLSVTPAFLDRLTNCPGFTAALLKVGWLMTRNGRLSAPNFDRKNGQVAKRRALTKDRVNRSRSSQSNDDVTLEALRPRAGPHICNSTPENRSNVFKAPSLEEVRTYCLERSNSVDPEQFVNFYTAKGWKIGKNRMKDWKAAVRTWERNSESSTVTRRDPRGNLAAGDEFLRQREAMRTNDDQG